MNFPADKKIFEYRIIVDESHLDELNHVNNVVYVQLMQDAAGKHWNSVSQTDAEQELVWVVRHHAIDYLNQAFLGDELLIKTWTGAHGTASWDRHYEIIRIADGKKIISAKSVWVLLDKVSGRPRRIDDSILERFEIA